MFNLRKDYQQQTTTPNVQQPLSETSAVLLQPKEIEIEGSKFIISKMPCTVAQEVLFNLPTGLIPLLSNFSKSEEMAFKMLSYCERVYTDRPNVPLKSKVLIDNHVPDFNTLIKLEQEVLQYNFDFFASERVLNFLNEGLSRVESKASGILTDLLDKLLQVSQQPLNNSEQSIH